MTNNPGIIPKIQRTWKLRKRLYHRMLDTDAALTLGTALLVGVGAGFGAVIFRRLIESIHDFFLQQCSILVRVGFPASSDFNAGPGRTDRWSPGILFCP